MSESPREQENNRSSLFDKLPPDLRRQLDLAIVHRVPPTFTDLWMQFELAKYGVSFSALYRYARRLRDRVNTAEAVLLAEDEDADLDATIQKLLSRRLLELLLHTGGAECTQEIAALTSAHRKGAKTAHDGRRLDLARDHLRLKSEPLQSARDRVLSLADEIKKRRASAANRVNPVNPVSSDEAKPFRLARRDDSAKPDPPNVAPAPTGANPQLGQAVKRSP